jgi:Protein of unknown function (DUF3891)
MIVSRREEGLLLVLQVDHQEQCAAMAEGWGNDDFAQPEPYGPIMDAARVHDEGWRSWEAAPTVTAAGSPTDFVEIDRPTHVRLYAEGIRQACALSDRIGLLVSMHGQGLYDGRRGLDAGAPPPRAERPPEVREFLAQQDELQERLRARIGGEELDAWAWAAYRLLQTWDVLSLYLTWRHLPAGREMTLPQVPRGIGDPGVALSLRPDGPRGCVCTPWPFRLEAVELPVAGRVVEDRPYEDDADLRRALDAAPRVGLGFTVRPG